MASGPSGGTDCALGKHVYIALCHSIYTIEMKKSFFDCPRVYKTTQSIYLRRVVWLELESLLVKSAAHFAEKLRVIISKT